MQVVIVEDEKAAARRLSQLLKELNPEIHVAGIMDTVSRAVQWFRSNPYPDLAFFDIQLADGIGFDIFDQVRIDCPVIFTTAYDNYALRAFEVNSIDYLLKPVDRDKLQRALGKYKNLTGVQRYSAIAPEIIMNAMDLFRRDKHKERFVVKYGDHLKSIPVSEISCFISQSKATYLNTDNRHRFLIDFSLEKIESMVDPKMFFRINRGCIVSIRTIKEVVAYSNSRLRVILKDINDPDMIVAREKVQDFKTWLDK